MANYNIVVDTSNFKPFDINPALTILNAYAAKREKDQAIYDTIAQQLGELATAVRGNKITKAIWDQYNGDLQAAMADFAQGSSQATGRALSMMRQRYFKDIVPLEKARQAMLKNLEAIRAKDDGALIHEDIGNLDYYYEHPDYIPKMYDAKLLRTQVETIIGNIAKGMVSMDKLGDLDPYTYKIITRTGFDPKEIQAAMANYLATGDTKNPIMQGVLDAVWDSTFSGWNMTDEIKRKGRSWMAQGLSAGSESKVEHAENWGAKQARQEAHAVAMENLRFAHELAKSQAEAQQKAQIEHDKYLAGLQQKIGMLGYDGVDDSLGTDVVDSLQKKQKDLSKGMQHAIQNGYITKNAKGEYVMTKKGVDTYYNSENPYSNGKVIPTTGGAGYIPPAVQRKGQDNIWRAFVDTVIGPNGSIKKEGGSKSYIKEGSDVFTRRWRRITREVDTSLKNPESFSNAYTTSGRVINMHNLTEALRSISGTTHYAKWNSKAHKWESTGKVFNQADLEDAKGRLQVGVNTGGIYFKYRDGDGKLTTLVPSDPNYLQHNPRAASAVAAMTRASLASTFKQLISAVNSGNTEEARRHVNKANEYIAQYNSLPGVSAQERVSPISLNNLNITMQDLAQIEEQVMQDNADIYDFLASLEPEVNITEDTRSQNTLK